MIALKYVGNGTYIHGVPARDLTDDEAALYGPVIREQEKAAHVTMYEAVVLMQVSAEADAGQHDKRTGKKTEEGDNGN